LTGTTVDGRQTTATGLFETAWLPALAEKDVVYRAHICRELHIGDSPRDASSGSSRFAVTNLQVTTPVPIHHPSAAGEIRRIGESDERVRRLEFTKGVDITAELTITSGDPDLRNHVAQDVCDLLSLGQGRRVQWISRVDHSSSGDALHWYHATLVTKPYNALPVIDPREHDDMTRFLDVSLPAFLARRESGWLGREFVDAYLDAKSQVDFLELRGAKLAVTLEMLKASMIAAGGAREFVRAEADFKAVHRPLQAALGNVLREHGWTGAERAVVHRNLDGLNRVPFRDLMESLCSEVGLALSDEDFRRFVKCRNSLVHRGRFYCETANADQRRNCPPHDSKVHEYLWLLQIVDRLFLRLVGYDGPWIDWSVPGNPQRRDCLLVG
jgi:hypothetical protein